MTTHSFNHPEITGRNQPRPKINAWVKSPNTGKHYFISSTIVLNSAAAESFCQVQFGGNLASIHTKAENNFIYNSLVRQLTPLGSAQPAFHIGGKRDLSVDANMVAPYSWTWTDGTPFDIATQYANCTMGRDCFWSASKFGLSKTSRGAPINRNEPNNIGGKDYCLSMAGRKTGSNPAVWRDDPCSKKLGFICQVPAGAPVYPCGQPNAEGSNGASFVNAYDACTKTGRNLTEVNSRFQPEMQCKCSRAVTKTCFNAPIYLTNLAAGQTGLSSTNWDSCEGLINGVCVVPCKAVCSQLSTSLLAFPDFPGCSFGDVVSEPVFKM